MQHLRIYQITIYLALVLFPITTTAQIEELNFSSETNSKINLKGSSKTTKINEVSAVKDQNLIHTGDLIDVDILGSTEYDWRGKVTPEGFISGLNFIENIYARCQTVDSLGEKVSELYTKFLRDPKVVIKILDRSDRPKSTLLGAVKIQQNFQLKREIHLNELIIISGGLTDTANGEIQILRQKNTSCSVSQDQSVKQESDKINNKAEFIDVSQNQSSLEILNIKVLDMLAGEQDANPQILYGDVITVKEAEPVYVIGGVNNPGKILFRPELTVSRSIAIAGGFTKKAKPEKVRIFRRENDETKIIEINLEQLGNEEKDELLLQPYDIVEVSGKGDDRKYSPINEFTTEIETNYSKLPLRVID